MFYQVGIVPRRLFQTPLQQALSHKDAGNKLFKANKFIEAIERYNSAIEICPTDKTQDLATFFQNRAATYEQLRLYEKVKEDCSRALELNPRYVKALQRRAKACEVTKDLQQSLEDVTSACILEGFQNQTTLLTADRVLKGLGRKHAKEAMAKRTPIMPSKHFIKTYFSSFVEDPITKNLADEKESESAEADVRLVSPKLRQDCEKAIFIIMLYQRLKKQHRIEHLKVPEEEVEALALLDNAPTYLDENKLCSKDKIEFMFLPPDTTSVFQPLNQGVIYTAKRLYERKLLSEILEAEEPPADEDDTRARLDADKDDPGFRILTEEEIVASVTEKAESSEEDGEEGVGDTT
uniref:DDE-1 domain-containing protein n=1 Tax=Timema douglasi TaxID=61478 RepID=A0A7R8VKL9_TIMDO|nr:unnamed protein product [Timema douglasi]